MTVRLIFAAVLAALLTAPLMAQVQKKEMPGIRNYSRVDATVGCGGQVDPAAMKALKGEGFVSVINLRLPTEEGANVDAGRAAAQAAGLKYIHLPFNAAQPDPKVVDSFLAAVADKNNQPVFIHCGSANRVGGMWMIKRVLQDKWALDRAATEAEAIGLNNAALKQFATDYIAQHR
ncbi:MAG TPA: sulfur transferase domain-containing protein [Vicinamibacterales bacterium]